MRYGRKILLVVMLTSFALAPMAARANTIIADLSKDHISIKSNFAGEKLLLFGAVEATVDGPISDIIVILRGPGENFTLRKKEKKLGVWVNNAAYDIGPLPGFYAVASTKKLSQMAPANVLREHSIGANAMSVNFLSSNIEPSEQAEAIAGFIRLKQARALYAEAENGVQIIGGRLFRAEINLPSGMPVGTYVTEFFAFQNGRLVGYQTGELPVDIVGAGHILHQAAYEMPLVYGIGGVVMACFMGWGVATLFRRR
jgi:uncharacterized protein (TIGR02186 family)